jgi:anhydro-N-acetylmuramic acid kinase
MSGTSLDGVDAALVRVSGSRRETAATLVSFVTLPFPNDLRARVLAVSHGEGNAETVSRLNFALGALFAGAAEASRSEGKCFRRRR